MTAFYLLLLVLATVCFILAALNKNVRNYNLIALGLFFWMLVPTFQTLDRLL